MDANVSITRESNLLHEAGRGGFVIVVKLLLFLVLLVVCWPLAVLFLLLYPVFWLLTLPLRLVGAAFDLAAAAIRLVVALFTLPLRMLTGGRP